jgi:hypothetical protein
MTDRQIRMEHAQAQRTEVQNKVLRSQEHRRLAELVRIMALEIEHLNEETKQLGAAVLMYREVVRRTEAAGFLQRQKGRADALKKEQATSLDHVSPVMRAARQ